MNKVFSNTLIFSIVFFFVLTIDVFVKVSLITSLSRYVTKPMVLLLLIGYYAMNFHDKHDRNYFYMLIGLCVFLIGDLVLIDTNSGVMYIVGMFLFIVGKVFYTIRFSNTRDFKISRIIPFLIACFVYTLWIMNLIYDNLGSFFIPTLIYLFVSIVVLLVSFLRRNDVNDISYYLVFTGVLLSIVYDSITAISSFYNPDLPFQEIAIMLFYGISQYLIVVGITKEIKQEENLVGPNSQL